mgnify:CR=1 FL=1
MLLYLGVISRENMQIEGFWYYLFLGVFEAATIHYAVAKTFTVPLLFGSWLVRLRLLDSYGAGLSALQSAAEATKRKAGLPSLCDVFSVSGVGVWAVSDAGGTSGANHVLAFPGRECALLPCRYCVCLPVSR